MHQLAAISAEICTRALSGWLLMTICLQMITRYALAVLDVYLSLCCPCRHLFVGILMFSPALMRCQSHRARTSGPTSGHAVCLRNGQAHLKAAMVSMLPISMIDDVWCALQMLWAWTCGATLVYLTSRNNTLASANLWSTSAAQGSERHDLA